MLPWDAMGLEITWSKGGSCPRLGRLPSYLTAAKRLPHPGRSHAVFQIVLTSAVSSRVGWEARDGDVVQDPENRLIG